jgi:hypothetical protein
MVDFFPWRMDDRRESKINACRRAAILVSLPLGESLEYHFVLLIFRARFANATKRAMF